MGDDKEQWLTIITSHMIRINRKIICTRSIYPRL